MMRRFALLLLLIAGVAAQEAKVLSRTHDRGHAAIEEELRQDRDRLEKDEPFDDEEGDDVESFTCTLTGAAGQEQCDAAQDDDGSKCVWCVLNGFGFCVSEEQAQTFEQAIPTIDCDDSDNDDKPATDDDNTSDGPLWDCLESKDKDSCGDTCVWCNTKGGFGVCLTKDGADMASNSYWFDCPEDDESEDDEDASEDSEDEEESASLEEGEPESYYDEEEDEEELEDYPQDRGGEDEEEDEYEEDEEEGDYDDDEYEEEEEEGDYDDEDEEDEDMHEFVVDTTCVLSAMLLDPADEDATSEAACFKARDSAGQPCEWCAVAGSPFRLCLSEPQAQVAEYVGAICTGSDESFEPEDFDDSCIAHMKGTDLTKEGCWQHMDLDGNGCEWCNVMGVELCLGGVQAELVEHWGATCVLDDAEHQMAQAAIQQHQLYVEAQRMEEKRKQREADASITGDLPPAKKEEEDEEEIDLATLWLTSDPSCMVTTLRTSNGEDDELACAQTQDAEGNPCNWCQMGTSFYLCLNDEQADVAEYVGIECETISTDTQDILKEHQQRAEEYEDSDDEDADEEDEEDSDEEEESEKEEGDEDDVEDFDPSCILSMQNGPDQTACVNTKDQDGQACEWCRWNTFNICLASEQAEIVEPFGVKCDQVYPREASLDRQEEAIREADFWDCLKLSTASTSCTAAKACGWCNTAAGVGLCLSNTAVENADEHEFFECLDDPEEEDEPMVFQEGPKVDTSCLIDGGRYGTADKCESSTDAVTGKPCEWCQLGSLGINACMSAEQADLARPLGVTCNTDDEAKQPEVPAEPILQNLPKDFWSCLSQSSALNDCDETCTWCDLQGSTTGAGLCLSDPIADLVSHVLGDGVVLECTEPADDEEKGGAPAAVPEGETMEEDVQ